MCWCVSLSCLAASFCWLTSGATTEAGEQSTVSPSVHGGWGWGSQVGSHGGPAGGSSLDGWDDMDPMAMLSQSVQSRARAHDRDSMTPAQATQAEAARLSQPAELLSTQASQEAPHTESSLHTSTSQNHTALSEQDNRPVSSRSQTASQCMSSDCHDQHEGLDSAQQQQHLVDQHQANQIIMTLHDASAEKGTAAPTDAQPSPVRYNSSQQGELSTALPDVHANQDANHADSVGVDVTHPADLEGSAHQDTAGLTAESSIADVQSMLGQGDRAMIHTRAPGKDAFGPTVVYGYPGVVLEATQAGHIATVTVFQV